MILLLIALFLILKIILLKKITNSYYQLSYSHKSENYCFKFNTNQRKNIMANDINILSVNKSNDSDYPQIIASIKLI